MGSNIDRFDLDHLFKRLYPRLEILEQERIVLAKKLDKLKKSCLLGSIIPTVILFPFWGIMSPILFGALGITIYTIFYHKMKKIYREGYKDNVFRELVAELGSNYTFNVKGEIVDEILENSGLFYDFNKKQCEDLITAKFEDHSFKLAEVQLFREVKSKNIDHGSSLQYIFKGIFFYAAIPLKFPTKIWILSNDHPTTYGKSRVSDQWQKVELQHMEFQKEYEVFAVDCEIASKILQDSILDTILETRKEVVEDKMRMELSFQENHVFLSISTSKQLFEPPITTPITDFEDFRVNFKYLVNATSLLQKLTLVKT